LEFARAPVAEPQGDRTGKLTLGFSMTCSF
jgi:hypothetical protein